MSHVESPTKTGQCRRSACLRRSLRPARIAPVYPFQEIAELRRRHRHGGAILADRPDELAGLEALYVKRHADTVMPQDLDQITLAPPEAEDLAAMRIAAKALLNLQRQAVHAATHVRHPARDPYVHPGRKGDHDASRIGNRRARMVGSSEAGIVRRRPFGRPISIVLSPSDRSGPAISEDAGGGGEIVSGTKLVDAEALRRPLRYSRRQRVNNDRDNPYRRAVTDPCRKPCKLSSTIRTSEPSLRPTNPVGDQDRRRTRPQWGEMIVAHDIRHGLKANHQIRAAAFGGGIQAFARRRAQNACGGRRSRLSRILGAMPTMGSRPSCVRVNRHASSRRCNRQPSSRRFKIRVYSSAPECEPPL